ncbi:MAG: hypothetical protein KDJ88_14970 [Bauldia sp.]|nr:hypothetical protein [Bauldia sp.]
MVRSSALAFALLVVATPTVATAGPDCVCRADGRLFHQGDLFCLRTPQGETLARCEMSQNVTTWRVIEQGCPTTDLTPPSHSSAVLVSLAPSSPPVEN